MGSWPSPGIDIALVSASLLSCWSLFSCYPALNCNLSGAVGLCFVVDVELADGKKCCW